MKKSLVACSILLLASLACSLVENALGISVEDEASLADLSGRALAEALADRMARARSNRARERTLLQVMEAVHVGVYTPEGMAVARGAERGWGDFYLYDFELQALAENLGRDQTYDLTTIAAILEQVGLQIEGTAPTAQDVLRGLQQAIIDSRENPDDPYSLVPFLIQEIGLQRKDSPYDLAQEQTVEQVRLDGLQSLLVLGDLLLPYVYATDPIEGPVDLGGTIGRGGLAAPLPIQTDDCAGLLDPDNAKIPYWGKTLIRAAKLTTSGASIVVPKLRVAGRVLGPLAAALVTIEALHGVMLAVGIEVKELEARVGPTHYGHGSPGKKLEFRIRVVNHMDIPEALVNCGWLATVEFPPQGPVSGVDVVWFADDLKNHGTLDCTSGYVFPCYSTTGSDGIAKLTFTPKDETRPYGKGLEREEMGIVTGVAQYQTAHGNSLVGRIGETVTPLRGSIAWSVRFHTKAYEASGGSQATWSGTICSLEAPFRLLARRPNGTLPFEFVPGADAMSGTWTYVNPDNAGGVVEAGTGTYSVSLQDSGEGVLTVSGSGRIDIPDFGSETFSANDAIQLRPRDPC